MRRYVLVAAVALVLVLALFYAACWRPLHGRGGSRPATPSADDDLTTPDPEVEPDEPLDCGACDDPADAAGDRLPLLPPGQARGPFVRYVPRSSVKIEQLVGEVDKERHVNTRSRTLSRFGLEGTDLGYSFEHAGHAVFLFGDTVGTAGGALDSMAWTEARDPERGVALDFFVDGSRYLTVSPPGISMGGYEVPVSGISAGGEMYVIVRTNWGPERESTTARSVLTRYTAPTTFTPLRTLSSLPDGHFVTTWLHHTPIATPASALPDGGPFYLQWGTGVLRKSDLYLAVVPAAQLESGQGTRYYAGPDAAGAPTWSRRESDASPILREGGFADVSVTWCPELELWLLTYNGHKPRGIFFTYAKNPWGPFAEPTLIFGAKRDRGLGVFIHDPTVSPDDGLEGPVIGPKPSADPAGTRGSAYGPFVVERWTKVTGKRLSIYYVLSTWNPYVVVLMKSEFRVVP